MSDESKNLVFPQVHHDTENDCLELIMSEETYVARWVGPNVTIYIGRESKNPVGFFIDGVTIWMTKALADPNPRDPKGA